MMGGGRVLARATSELGLGPGGPPGRALAVLVAAVIAAFGLASLTTSRSGPAPAGPPERPPVGQSQQRDVDPVGLGRAAPVWLRISSIDVDIPVASLSAVGDELTNSLSAGAAGWYEGGTSPGELGSAVIMGRLARPGGDPAVFARIGRLVEGDRIDVVRQDGVTASFVVDRVAPYSPSELYRHVDARPRLRLVGTGGGPQARPQVVVYATARDSRPVARGAVPGSGQPADNRPL